MELTARNKRLARSKPCYSVQIVKGHRPQLWRSIKGSARQTPDLLLTCSKIIVKEKYGLKIMIDKRKKTFISQSKSELLFWKDEGKRRYKTCYAKQHC